MFKKLASGVLASALLLATATADAAMNAYVTIVGQKSGQIKGGVIEKGRENSILATAASHSIVSPRDPQSGLPTGKRMHKPFVITKEVDKASPLLYNVLVTNENLTTVTLKFWAPAKSGVAQGQVGQDVQTYTVKLTNASISSIVFHDGEKIGTGTETAPATEEISFTYQKIEWTWNDGGITASDSVQ